MAMADVETRRPDPQEIFDLIPTGDRRRIVEFLNTVPGARDARDANGAGLDHWLAYYGMGGLVGNWLDCDSHLNHPIHYERLAGLNSCHPVHEGEGWQNEFGYNYQDIAEATYQARLEMMFGDRTRVDW